MAIWLAQTDIQQALSVATFSAIFDDAVTGVTDPSIVSSVIEQGEQEVLSYLIGEYGTQITSDATLGADLFLRGCALEFAKYFAFDRYPEYVRANGPEQAQRYERAQKRMERVLQARQRPTTLQTQPANVGGVVVDNGPRIAVDSADGTFNGGDYAVVEREPDAELVRLLPAVIRPARW